MPAIKTFGVVRDLLEGAFDSEGVPRELYCMAIKQALCRMSGQCRAGGEEAIDYGNLYNRLGYVYSCMAAKADLLQQIIEADAALLKRLRRAQQTNGRVAVCAFGGGPGSELLALTRTLEASARVEPQEAPFELHVANVSRTEDWIGCWEALLGHLHWRLQIRYGASRRDWPVIPEGVLGRFEPDTCEEQAFHLPHNYDMYVFSHTFCENWKPLCNPDMLRKATRRLTQGTPLVFIARDHGSAHHEMAELLAALTGKKPTVHRWHQPISVGHEVSGLGDLRRYIKWQPRLTNDVIWGVAVLG